MNLFTKFEAALPLSEFLAKHGTDAHRNRWKFATEQTTLTDAQRKLLGTFTRRTNVLVLARAFGLDRFGGAPSRREPEYANGMSA